MANQVIIDGEICFGSTNKASAIICKDKQGNEFSLQTALDNLIDYIYPIGSVYISVNEVSPSILFGGTWEKIKDTFLLAAGDYSSAGETGGEAYVALTQNEIPNYKIGFLPQAVMGNHGNWTNNGIKAASQTRDGRNTVTATSGTSDPQWGYDIYTDGGGQAHNNIPPFLSVNIWKRTG